MSLTHNNKHLTLEEAKEYNRGNSKTRTRISNMNLEDVISEYPTLEWNSSDWFNSRLDYGLQSGSGSFTVILLPESGMLFPNEDITIVGNKEIWGDTPE